MRRQVEATIDADVLETRGFFVAARDRLLSRRRVDQAIPLIRIDTPVVDLLQGT